MQEPVDFEKAVAGEFEAGVVAGEVAPVGDGLEGLGETLAGVDAEFFVEVGEVEVAEFELEDEFADEEFVGVGGEGAVDGEVAAVELGEVFVDLVLVLVVGAVDVAEGGDADGEEVCAFPEEVAVEEIDGFVVANGGVGGADAVAVFFEFGEGFVDPAAFGFPVGDGGGEFAGGRHVLIDGGVEGDFHLVDRDGIGLELEGLLDVALPVVVGFVKHTGDEVDVDLGEAGVAGSLVGLVNFFGAVGAAVEFEDVGVEVFHAEGEAGDAEGADVVDFFFGEGAGFGFEGDFAGVVPGEAFLEGVGEFGEEAGVEEGGGAAAEVDEVGGATADEGLLHVHVEFAGCAVDVGADFLGAGTGDDLEVAEVAALAAEGDVDVEAEGIAGFGRALHGGEGLGPVVG